MSDAERVAVLGRVEADQDTHLVRRFLDGDRRAFDQLVSRYQRPVHSTCLHMLGDPSDAEDAAQEVFIGVYKALPRFRMDSKLSTWIYRIAVNKCICHRRARRPRATLEEVAEETFTPLEGIEDRWLVASALQQTPARYRALLVLRYYREFSYEEIAEIMGWNTSKVRSSLQRARNAFKTAFEREHGNGGSR